MIYFVLYWHTYGPYCTPGTWYAVSVYSIGLGSSGYNSLMAMYGTRRVTPYMPNKCCTSKQIWDDGTVDTPCCLFCWRCLFMGELRCDYNLSTFVQALYCTDLHPRQSAHIVVVVVVNESMCAGG